MKSFSSKIKTTPSKFQLARDYRKGKLTYVQFTYLWIQNGYNQQEQDFFIEKSKNLTIKFFSSFLLVFLFLCFFVGVLVLIYVN